jgi:SAM-dependent methyltransferase
MYQLHNYCRACGYATAGAQGIKAVQTDKLIEVLDLGVQPLANDFRREGEERAGYAPLKVMFCPRCTLAQLSVVVSPEVLYRNYSYVTSPSATMEAHFEKLIANIQSETDGNSVLEIGSNDGRLLAMMQKKGYTVQGVDPAENLTEAASANGVSMQSGFFNEDFARMLPQVDIVIARHVFCHVDDWKDFIRGLEAVSHKETLICIEVPYAGDTLKNCEFDQVYHEHLSFLSIGSMFYLLRDSCLHIHKITRYPIHGGAILIMLKVGSATALLDWKESITVEDWKAFGIEARAQIDRLRNTVQAFRAQGKSVAALGASAKSTVWINACGFTRKDVAFIADNTPQKQLTVSPGTDIPIVDEGAILREEPDYLIIFCWNFLGECLEKFALARSKGVKFIIPVPKIEVI